MACTFFGSINNIIIWIYIVNTKLNVSAMIILRAKYSIHLYDWHSPYFANFKQRCIMNPMLQSIKYCCAQPFRFINQSFDICEVKSEPCGLILWLSRNGFKLSVIKENLVRYWKLLVNRIYPTKNEHRLV